MAAPGGLSTPSVSQEEYKQLQGELKDERLRREGLQALLEKERADHSFTTLLMEDEVAKVRLGIEVIRRHQEEARDWRANMEQYQQLQEYTVQLEQEHEQLKLQHHSLTNHCEGLELLLHKQQANYEVDKGTLEGVITILQGQLQQKHSEGLSFENLLQRLQDIEANGRNANTNNNGNKVNTKSPTTSYNNRKHSQTDKTMKEQEATIKSQTTKLRELLDSQYAENPISSISGLVTDLLTHVLEHTKILGEELQKEREKNALLIERLDQELENEDTLLLTMDNLEKQISQISCNSRSYSFNFLSASEAKDKEIDRDGQNKDNERA